MHKHTDNAKLSHVINIMPPSNIMIYGMTNASMGSLNIRQYLGEPLPKLYKDEALQNNIDTLAYFERKEGKQMLADGFKLHDLNPIMRAALKHDKTLHK